MAVESLPGRAYRLFPQSGRATRKLIGRRSSRPRQPSLEDGRASSQKTATELRDLSGSGAHAGPFHLWPPQEASKSLGVWSLECAVVRSRAPSNTRLHLQGAPQRLASDETRRPHLRALTGASRCCTARSFGLPRSQRDVDWSPQRNRGASATDESHQKPRPRSTPDGLSLHEGDEAENAET